MPDSETSAQPNPNGLTMPLRVWLAVLATGAGAGVTSGLLMRLLRLAQHVSFHYRQGDFLIGVEGVSGLRRVIVLLCAGVLAGIVLLAVRRISDHDGPELNEAIRQHSGQLPERSMTVRAVLSVVIVGMGAAIGREAALKQAGGIVGKKFAELSRLTAEQRQLLVACGVGAGMAAAYNVPFGGALFTLEALLGTVSLPSVLAAFITSFLATAVSWLMLPNEPTYRMASLHTTGALVAWAFLAGPLMGLASVWFVRGIHWGKDYKPKNWEIVALPVAIFVLLGLASIPFPQLLGNGKNVVQLAFDFRMGTGLLCWLLVLRPLATMLVLRSGAPGGLFTPTMTFGALVGAALGQAWSYVAAGTDKRGYAVVGAAAVLAAATQAPISSVAFILELTDRSSPLLVPILIAVVGATLTFRRFETRSTY